MSKKLQDSPNMLYLKQDQIGRVLSKAMSKLYQQKPQKPVSYLAHWLLNYSANIKKLQSLKKEEQHKQKNLKQYNQQIQLLKQKLKKQSDQKNAIEAVHKSFEQKISSHQYHYELLLQELPQFLQKNKKLTGVYIGQLNHPSKKVTQQDVDENAHLNLQSAKLINYIGSSKSHSALMINKTLHLDKGVTGQVFSLNNQQVVQGEEKKQKKKYIYVPDVVKNEKINYFKLPKLGAYLAIPLIYKSYLFEKTFDGAVQQRKTYGRQKQQFRKQKQNGIASINKQLQEAFGRLKTHQQKNQQDQINKVREQIKQIESRKTQKQKQQFEYNEPQYQGKKKQFVVCIDTLGQDREISQQDRQYLYNFVQRFKNSWEGTELRLLKQCVDIQIQYQSNLKKAPEAILQNIQKQNQMNEQSLKQLTSKYQNNQKQLNYHILIFKKDKLKQNLTKTQYKKYLLQLANYRILKFPQIIQNSLYFLGKTKQQIDIPNTTQLNWKFVRKNLFNQQFIKKILAYDFRGAKPNQVKKYAKINRLLSILQKIPQQSVVQYNIGLAMLLKYLKKILKLRIQDIQIRKLKIQQLKKERIQKLAQNQKILQEKEVALQQHKLSLSAQQLQSFKQEDWLKDFDIQHPLIEIPPEIHDDVDNDI